ncbi:MAG: cysteine desulfurase [Thermoguttaceae bacterium]|nr:cysteine desulfurase [Thermoguttaceae bacterium]MDW8038197.1 cysteine desulfurase family protein [Thermoguttaceae bacterium]
MPKASSVNAIYLDHNATTPIRPEVVEAMREVWLRVGGNPASQHQFGREARRLLEEAREKIAHLLGAEITGPEPDRLIFTASATEANNLAICGIALARTGGQPGSFITSSLEHPSVLGPAEHLVDLGWRVDTLGATPDGIVRLDQLQAWISPQTALVSIIAANHEIGTLQPIAEAVRICQAHGVPLHTDAVQLVGKWPVHFRRLGVSAMTVAAHKFHGPVGIGALVVRHGVPIQPVLFGGHQQEGLRPGTEAVALAVGMATALELWQKEQQEQIRQMAALRERFEQKLLAGWPEILIHGRNAPRLPNTSCIAFPGLDGQVLFTALDVAGVACSIGSACMSGSTEPSPTLMALGLPKELVLSSLRFSLGTTTTEHEIEEAIRRILQVCDHLGR